jgi:hypothetical protein
MGRYDRKQVRSDAENRCLSLTNLERRHRGRLHLSAVLIQIAILNPTETKVAVANRAFWLLHAAQREHTSASDRVIVKNTT